MLGLGHGINKSVIRKKYGLDFIPGGIENNVLWLSYHQMTGQRNDECFRLRDLTTSDEWDIGRIDGYVDYNRVLSLLSGHNGLAAKIYNNTLATGATDAIQTNVANMPLVATGGVFNHDGFQFVGTSSNFMSIVDYAGIQIINPPISFYSNFTSSSTGFVFSKKDATTYQFSLFNYMPGNYFGVYINNFEDRATKRSTSNCKGIARWLNKNSGGFSVKTQDETKNTTLNATLTNITTCQIGANNSSLYFTGNIKTISISAGNLYDYYDILAAMC